MFGNPARNVDDASCMPGMHPVIDLDDGATLAIKSADHNQATQWKMIARTSKQLAIEAFAGRCRATAKPLPVKTGLTAEARRTSVNDICHPQFAT